MFTWASCPPSPTSPMALVGVGVRSDFQGFLAQQSGLAEEAGSDTQGPLCGYQTEQDWPWSRVVLVPPSTPVAPTPRAPAGGSSVQAAS